MSDDSAFDPATDAENQMKMIARRMTTTRAMAAGW